MSKLLGQIANLDNISTSSSVGSTVTAESTFEQALLDA